MALGSGKLRDFDEDLSPRKKRKQRSWLHEVDVIDFLETMDCINISQATSDEVIFSCPFPGHTHGDERPSAYMNDGSKDKSKATAFKCHGCGRAGNAISFYAEMEDVTKQEAARHLREQYAPNFRAPKGGSISAEFELFLNEREKPVSKPVLPEIPQERYDKLFGVDWPDAWCEWSQTHDPILGYMFERGFEPETLIAWDVGYDDRSQRFTIPIRDERGVIVGVKGRTWKSKAEEKRKYLILGDKAGRSKRYGWPHYEKTLVLFGIDKCLDAERLVLVEGELDVLALWQVGIPAVATGSAHLSRAQQVLVRDHAREVVVFYDSNTAGVSGTWGYHDKEGDFHPGVVQHLEPHLSVRVVEDHESDASDMVQHGRLEELRALIDNAPSSISLLLR